MGSKKVSAYDVNLGCYHLETPSEFGLVELQDHLTGAIGIYGGVIGCN